jgi:molybdopterin synthase catalytic subunit
MNEVKVLFFANLRDVTGKDMVDISLGNNASIADLKLELVKKIPELETYLPTILIAVNHEYAIEDDQIPDGAEVALFPPVSGGADESFPTYLAITMDEIELNELVKIITIPTTGAVGMFTGLVREITTRGEKRKTRYLEYEAYKTMGERKLKQVADEIRERWPHIEGIAIVQRIGRLYPGTITVTIACSASHRDTGVFEASRYGIDRLKEIVPVWKKEVGEKDEVWIEGKYFPTQGSDQ